MQCILSNRVADVVAECSACEENVVEVSIKLGSGLVLSRVLLQPSVLLDQTNT